MFAVAWVDSASGVVSFFVPGSDGSLAGTCFEVAARSASLVSGGDFQYRDYSGWGKVEVLIYRSRRGLC